MKSKAALTLFLLLMSIFFILIFIFWGYARLMVIYVVLFVLGLAGLFVARYLITLRDEIVLRGVGQEYALKTVYHALYNLEDTIFGYPSGKFDFKNDPQFETGKITLVATEWQPKGSLTVLRNILLLPWRIGSAIVLVIADISDSFLFLAIGYFVQFCLAVYLLFIFIIPLIAVTLMELVFRPLLGAEITAEIIPGDNEVAVKFAFKGVTAHLARRRLLSTFDRPVLPSAYVPPSLAQTYAALEAKYGNVPIVEAFPNGQ